MTTGREVGSPLGDGSGALATSGQQTSPGGGEITAGGRPMTTGGPTSGGGTRPTRQPHSGQHAVAQSGTVATPSRATQHR